MSSINQNDGAQLSESVVVNLPDNAHTPNAVADAPIEKLEPSKRIFCIELCFVAAYLGCLYILAKVSLIDTPVSAWLNQHVLVIYVLAAVNWCLIKIPARHCMLNALIYILVVTIQLLTVAIRGYRQVIEIFFGTIVARNVRVALKPAAALGIFLIGIIAALIWKHSLVDLVLFVIASCLCAVIELIADKYRNQIMTVWDRLTGALLNWLQPFNCTRVVHNVISTGQEDATAPKTFTMAPIKILCSSKLSMVIGIMFTAAKFLAWMTNST